ncbi:MAG: hypothetical protein M3256_20730 [Actinomycetota bacterium]|nr:hypothetical protein [Actinomycetota bacterium]
MVTPRGRSPYATVSSAGVPPACSPTGPWRAKPIANIAADIGINESCLRNWLARADIDEGHKEGLTTAEQDEVVKLRRENRALRMEKEILGKAAA